MIQYVKNEQWTSNQNEEYAWWMQQQCNSDVTMFMEDLKYPNKHKSNKETKSNIIHLVISISFYVWIYCLK